MGRHGDALTPLGVMLLALLREADMHPYEMVRLLREREDTRIVTVTGGTVYHTVERLLRGGLVGEVGTDRNGNRPERTTYALTEAGHVAVDEWVRRELPTTGRPREFRVALAEAHNLPRDEVIALLDTRRDSLETELNGLRPSWDAAVREGVPMQYLIEAERDLELRAADLRWLEGILRRLRASDFPWGPAEGDPAPTAEKGITA